MTVGSTCMINQGVVFSGNSVTVEWQGTGPDPNNRVQDFLCSLDGGEGSSCTSAILYMIMFFFCVYNN